MSAFGDEDGMLELSGSLAISCDSCPVVRPGDVFMHSGINHWLDSENVTWFHEACSLIITVMSNRRCDVEKIADSMTTISAIHSQSILVG